MSGHDLKIRRINGWTYVSSDDRYEIKNAGRRLWIVLELGTDNEIIAERDKQYFTSYAEAKSYVLSQAAAL